MIVHWIGITGERILGVGYWLATVHLKMVVKLELGAKAGLFINALRLSAFCYWGLWFC